MSEVEPGAPDRSRSARDVAASLPPAGDGQGSMADGDLTALGIKRVQVDQFEVGGYRYTSLKDAIAQAARSDAEQRPLR